MLADWFLLVDSALKDSIELGIGAESTPDEELLSFKYCVSTFLVFNKVWQLVETWCLTEAYGASIVQVY